MRVCIGGTFSQLHKGHKSIIKKAFEVAGKNGLIFIGITLGEIIKRKGDVQPAEQGIRKGVLARKISAGRRTWTGAEACQVLLSALETSKKRNGNFIEAVIKN